MKCLVVFLVVLVACDALKQYCKGKKIEVIMEPPALVYVELGKPLSVVCAAHGHGTADPYVYWVKNLGPDFKDKGKNLGPVAIGKSILFFDAVKQDDITTYKCVIESCCTKETIEIPIDIKVPDETCADVYGVGPVVYGATWVFSNFSDAVQYCEDKGMVLAFPKNAEENALLLENIQASFNTHPNARKYAHENWLWIGGHDTAEEGVWVEQLTNTPLEFKNWQKGQPDNWNGNGGAYKGGQDVIGINRETGRWDDSFVFYKRPFACLCPTLNGSD